MAKRLWIPVQPRFTLSFKWPSQSLNRVNLQPLERCRYKISSVTSEHLCFASEDICFLQNAENAKMPNPKCAHKPNQEKGRFLVLIHVFVCLFFHMHWIPPGSLVVTAGKTRSPPLPSVFTPQSEVPRALTVRSLAAPSCLQNTHGPRGPLPQLSFALPKVTLGGKILDFCCKFNRVREAFQTSRV